MNRIEINEETLKSYQNVFPRSDYESPEEYSARLERIINDINKHQEMQELEKKLAKQKENRNIVKMGIKKLIKFVSILGLSTTAAGAGYYGTVRWLAYESSKEVIAEGRDIKNYNYTANTSVEPGYYNDHPITIGISKNFNDYEVNLIQGAVSYLDEEAKGVKFETNVENLKGSDAQIKIYNVEGDKTGRRNVDDNAVAWASLPSKNQKRVMGSVYIDTQRFHPFTIYSTTIHELMHAVFGILHSDDMSSIMYPSMTTWKLSEQDKININAVYPEASETETNKNLSATFNLINESSLKSQVDGAFELMSKQLKNLKQNSEEEEKAYISQYSTQCENFISKLAQLYQSLSQVITSKIDLDKETLCIEAQKEMDAYVQQFCKNVENLVNSAEKNQNNTISQFEM